MIISGITTAFGPLTQMNGAFGYIYSTRITLVAFGIIFFCCGVALLYGKIRKSRKWVGRGLMSIYLCYLFATFLQGFAYHWIPGFWVTNAIMTVIVGFLFLRWKFQTEYINPKNFTQDVVQLKQDNRHQDKAS